MNAEGGEVLCPGRFVERYSGESDCCALRFRDIFRFSAHLFVAFGKAEPEIRKRKNNSRHGNPKQSVPEQITRITGCHGVLFRYRPVAADVSERANSKRVEDGAELLPLDVLQEIVGNTISSQKDQRGDEGNNFAACQNSNREQDCGDDESIWQCKKKNAVDVR